MRRGKRVDYSKIHSSHQVTLREEIISRKMIDSKMGHETKTYKRLASGWVIDNDCIINFSSFMKSEACWLSLLFCHFWGGNTAPCSHLLSIYHRSWHLPLASVQIRYTKCVRVVLLQPLKIVTNAVHGEDFWSQRVHGGIQEGKLSRNSGSDNRCWWTEKWSHISRLHRLYCISWALLLREVTISRNERIGHWWDASDLQSSCRCWVAASLWSRNLCRLHSRKIGQICGSEPTHRSSASRDRRSTRGTLCWRQSWTAGASALLSAFCTALIAACILFTMMASSLRSPSLSSSCSSFASISSNFLSSRNSLRRQQSSSSGPLYDLSDKPSSFISSSDASGDGHPQAES